MRRVCFFEVDHALLYSQISGALVKVLTVI
jgi:hypothetical protein